MVLFPVRLVFPLRFSIWTENDQGEMIEVPPARLSIPWGNSASIGSTGTAVKLIIIPRVASRLLNWTPPYPIAQLMYPPGTVSIVFVDPGGLVAANRPREPGMPVRYAIRSFSMEPNCYFLRHLHLVPNAHFDLTEFPLWFIYRGKRYVVPLHLALPQLGQP